MTIDADKFLLQSALEIQAMQGILPDNELLEAAEQAVKQSQQMVLANRKIERMYLESISKKARQMDCLWGGQVWMPMNLWQWFGKSDFLKSVT